MTIRGSSSTWLPVQARAIPAELRALPCVLWRAEPRGEDKPAKVPYCIATPSRRASSTDPSTWGSFEDAIEAYLALTDEPADPHRGPVAGIGVVLTREAEIVCVDLDRVIAPDRPLDARAQAIVERCDSWTEISPSGLGLHIFMRGRIPRAIKGDQVEVYAEARYIAVTGFQWPGTPSDLQPRQEYLDRLIGIDAKGRPAQRRDGGAYPPPPDDLAGALLAKLDRWGIRAPRVKPWTDGFLVELDVCPWASAHTTGSDGAAVIVRASGAFDFACLHAHCADRTWQDFRTVMDGRTL
jgi:hypothetical protein